MTTTSRAGSVVLAATVVFLGVRLVAACSVPVFRYALERWPADMYRLVVFHRGPLSKTQKADIEKLNAVHESESGLPPLGVFPVDVADKIPDELASLWKKERESDLPRAVLLYPAATMRDGIAWVGSLGEAALVVAELSPLRRELARRLIDGQTAVWILVESDDAEKDAQAEKVLTETLKEMKKELRLPHEIDPADAEYDTSIEEGVELKIEFSVMRFAPEDPKEALLFSILRGLLGEEMDEALPMAIPVFGRGRALAVIPWEQITDETIADVCFFLVGPCSCQVKAQNPGFDILLPVNWDGLVMGMIGAEEALPPLAVPIIARPEDTEAETAPDEATAPDGEAIPGEEAEPTCPSADKADAADDGAEDIAASTPLARNLIAIGAVALAVLAAATALVLRRGRDAKTG